MVKSENKQFQYEKQDYQETCINNTLSIFDSLHQKEDFVEVLTAHKNKHKYNFPIQNTKNKINSNHSQPKNIYKGQEPPTHLY